MRLAGGVADDRLALGEHGGHDRVLGRHHRGLVEVEARADEALRTQVVGAVQLQLDAELGERVDVGVEAPPADHVATGRRHDGAAESRERAGPRAGTRRESRGTGRGRARSSRRRSCRRAPRSVLSRPHRRRGRRAARPSPRRRGYAAGSRARPARRRARSRRGSARRRSCSRTRGSCRRAGDHPG